MWWLDRISNIKIKSQRTTVIMAILTSFTNQSVVSGIFFPFPGFHLGGGGGGGGGRRQGDGCFEFSSPLKIEFIDVDKCLTKCMSI